MKEFYDAMSYEIKKYIGYDGGPQSIRERPSNIKALSEGKYPSSNYGNTLEGSVQTLNTFGDKRTKDIHNLMCVPHINIVVEDGEHTEFITSDGAADCLTDDEIIRLFKYKENTRFSMDEFMKFIETSIDIQAVLGGFKLTVGVEHIPTWDDLSYWVIDTSVEEDLEYRIKKLEQENSEMKKLAHSIRRELDSVNGIINRL